MHKLMESAYYPIRPEDEQYQLMGYFHPFFFKIGNFLFVMISKLNPKINSGLANSDV